MLGVELSGFFLGARRLDPRNDVAGYAFTEMSAYDLRNSGEDFSGRFLYTLRYGGSLIFR